MKKNHKKHIFYFYSLINLFITVQQVIGILKEDKLFRFFLHLGQDSLLTPVYFLETIKDQICTTNGLSKRPITVQKMTGKRREEPINT